MDIENEHDSSGITLKNNSSISISDELLNKLHVNSVKKKKSRTSDLKKLTPRKEDRESPWKKRIKLKKKVSNSAFENFLDVVSPFFSTKAHKKQSKINKIAINYDNIRLEDNYNSSSSYLSLNANGNFESQQNDII